MFIHFLKIFWVHVVYFIVKVLLAMLYTWSCWPCYLHGVALIQVAPSFLQSRTAQNGFKYHEYEYLLPNLKEEDCVNSPWSAYLLPKKGKIIIIYTVVLYLPYVTTAVRDHLAFVTTYCVTQKDHLLYVTTFGWPKGRSHTASTTVYAAPLCHSMTYIV